MWGGGWACLGHRRLSVIDLSDAAAQPMVDEELGVAVVFNGCIYNYRELRKELGDARPFRSTSDTEVVLRAYERWGDGFVHRLVGMFAVAIVDQRRGAAVLARDRLGIKPLYLARVDGAVRFASHLPALVAAGGVDTSLDPVGLHHYLTWHSIVPAPRTILAGVEHLPPATVRVIGVDGSQTDTHYWQPAYERDPARAHWSERDWEDALEEALRVAVRRRLVADVPVGVLLSGGVDSSLLVALAAEEQDRVPTFSIGFEGPGRSGDEFVYSDAVAEAFGTDHHRWVVPDADMPGAVTGAIEAMSEPMASHDLPAFYLLGRTVADEVKVIQCGQGADEVFAGYAYHQGLGDIPRADAEKAFAAAFFDRSEDRLRRIVRPGVLPREDVSARLAAAHLSAPGAETALDAVLRFDTHVLMVDDPVKRVDNMTMAWGLEARVPFLDQDLVALAAACPPDLKARGEGKEILKRIARRLLPREVVDRPKGYFPVPALQELDSSVLELVREALGPDDARMREVIRPHVLDRMLAEPNATRTTTGGNALWPIAVLELWLQRHVSGPSRP